jgi:hypothetical protein
MTMDEDKYLILAQKSILNTFDMAVVKDCDCAKVQETAQESSSSS